MALLFRLNVISRKLTNFHYAFTHVFPPYHRRYIFTNNRSIYFAKNKVHDLRLPKCPDVEQYFQKVKKGDGDKKIPNRSDATSWDKKGYDNRGAKMKLPIFDDGKSLSLQSRSIANNNSFVSHSQGSEDNNESKSQSQNLDQLQPVNDHKISKGLPRIFNNPKSSLNLDKKKQSTTPSPVYDKKSSTSKPLDDFKTYSSKSTSIDKKGTPRESEHLVYVQHSTATGDQKLPLKIRVVDDYKSQNSESDSSETIRNKSDSNKKFIWLAAAAASICGIGLALLLKKTDSNVSSEITDESSVAIIENEDEQVTCPLRIPQKVPYLIIGGGTAGCSAFRAIKELVPTAKVLIISNEIYPPYMRPPLSKEMWSNKNTTTNERQENDIDEQIYFEPSNFYIDPKQLLNEPNGGVSILHGYAAQYLNICERKVILTDGTEIEYEKCLLATGSRPRSLLIFQTAPIRIRNKISFCTNISDFKSLEKIVDKSGSIAVIGGGFIASELSSALAKHVNDSRKLQVYQIFHENGNMGMTLPRYLSDWIKKRLTKLGVSVISNTQVDSVEMEDSKLKLGLLNGKLVVVDHVVVALGSKPDVNFARLSGLKVNNSNCGIVVNDHLEAIPNVYVAGDAACLQGKMGKETENCHDHAIATGRLAGENMCGHKKSFQHQSMFWSNVAPQISFESVGIIDAALKTVGVFSNGPDLERNVDDTNKGVIFYIKQDKVVGIVLWNIFDKINIARQVIAEGKKLYDLNEVAKRFEIEA